MLLDSNLIIYAAQAGYPGLRRFIAANVPVASAVSVVEVLGYHKLAPTEKQHFETFFASIEVLPISEAVVTQAVSIRQGQKMKLGDALIAATALVFGHELLTHNTDDFANVPRLVVIDPIATGDPT